MLHITNKMFQLSCLFFLCISLLACDKSNDSDAKEPILKPVRTLTISVGDQLSRSFPGVVDASQSAEVGFRVAGELKVVNVKEGQEVKKGEIIAELDKKDYEISLQGTKSEYQKAKTDFDRAEKLIVKGVISRSDYDKLASKLSSEEAKLESAQQNLKYTVLRAPFDGVVARTYLDNFEKVSGTEKFAAIQDLSAFEVSIDIPESIMIKVKREENAREVYATFNGDNERKYPLRFKEVATRADENTQTYKVRFVMEAPKDMNILPGMSTTVFAIEKNTSENSHDIFVPAHAVLEDSAGRFVYVVKLDTNQAQGLVERRSVVIGSLSENGLQIVKGLILGDKVITAGMSKISEGLAVRVMDGV